MLTISNSTFESNSARSAGAISNGGTATITSSTFTDNGVRSYGGAILNRGTMTITRSVFDGNTGHWGGSTIYSSATLMLQQSRVVNSNSLSNTSVVGNDGGNLVIIGTSITRNAGVAVSSSGSLRISHSIISGLSLGGEITISDTTITGSPHNGIRLWAGSLVLNHVTIAENAGGGIVARGDGLSTRSRAVTLHNSIVANNGDGDCSGEGITATNAPNLDSDGTCKTGYPPITGLGAFNGSVFVLAADSNAVDAGAEVYCVDTTSQNGVARPSGAGCEIGAYEQP